MDPQLSIQPHTNANDPADALQDVFTRTSLISLDAKQNLHLHLPHEDTQEAETSPSTVRKSLARSSPQIHWNFTQRVRTLRFHKHLPTTQDKPNATSSTHTTVRLLLTPQLTEHIHFHGPTLLFIANDRRHQVNTIDQRRKVQRSSRTDSATSRVYCDV